MSTNDVRVETYRWFIEEGRAPTVEELAGSLRLGLSEVHESLEQLDQENVIALDPTTRDLWLVHPFSARSEPFSVRAGQRSWDAICVWDALGILVIVGSDGSVGTKCPDCADSIVIDIADGKIVQRDYVVHFGVPAKRWYDDIAYT